MIRRIFDNNARKPPWMNKNLPSKVRARNEVFIKWKWREVASEEYRRIVWEARD